jgi:hypothetical protein
VANSSLIVSVVLAVCKSGEIRRDCRILRNEELHNLYLHQVLLCYKMKVREVGGACSKHGKEETCFLTGKPEGRRLRGRPRCRTEDTIIMDPAEIRLDLFGSG